MASNFFAPSRPNAGIDPLSLMGRYTIPGFDSPEELSGHALPFTGAQIPGTAPSGAGNHLQSVLDFLGSPGGQAATNFAGAGLSALGASQQAGAQRKQDATQFAASTRQNQFNADRNDQLTRAAGVLNADPLGAEQKYAQRNALMAAILPQARNARSTPGDPRVAAAMGQRTGGMSNLLPEGGLNTEMINSMFGPQATMAAIMKRQQELSSLDPHAAQSNLGTMYGDEAAAPFQAQIQGWAQQLQQKQGAEKAAFEAELNKLIQQQAQSGSGFWKNLAKIAGVVGAGAAVLMTAGGASPLLVGAVGAASGASSALGNGQNPLMSAIMSGASGYAGAQAQGRK